MTDIYAIIFAVIAAIEADEHQHGGLLSRETLRLVGQLRAALSMSVHNG